jgi:hypothetical protein
MPNETEARISEIMANADAIAQGLAAAFKSVVDAIVLFAKDLYKVLRDAFRIQPAGQSKRAKQRARGRSHGQVSAFIWGLV